MNWLVLTVVILLAISARARNFGGFTGDPTDPSISNRSNETESIEHAGPPSSAQSSDGGINGELSTPLSPWAAWMQLKAPPVAVLKPKKKPIPAFLGGPGPVPQVQLSPPADGIEAPWVSWTKLKAPPAFAPPSLPGLSSLTPSVAGLPAAGAVAEAPWVTWTKAKAPPAFVSPLQPAKLPTSNPSAPVVEAPWVSWTKLKAPVGVAASQGLLSGPPSPSGLDGATAPFNTEQAVYDEAGNPIPVPEAHRYPPQPFIPQTEGVTSNDLENELAPSSLTSPKGLLKAILSKLLSTKGESVESSETGTSPNSPPREGSLDNEVNSLAGNIPTPEEAAQLKNVFKPVNVPSEAEISKGNPPIVGASSALNTVPITVAPGVTINLSPEEIQSILASIEATPEKVSLPVEIPQETSPINEKSPILPPSLAEYIKLLQGSAVPAKPAPLNSQSVKSPILEQLGVQPASLTPTSISPIVNAPALPPYWSPIPVPNYPVPALSNPKYAFAAPLAPSSPLSPFYPKPYISPLTPALAPKPITVTAYEAKLYPSIYGAPWLADLLKTSIIPTTPSAPTVSNKTLAVAEEKLLVKWAKKMFEIQKNSTSVPKNKTSIIELAWSDWLKLHNLTKLVPATTPLSPVNPSIPVSVAEILSEKELPQLVKWLEKLNAVPKNPVELKQLIDWLKELKASPTAEPAKYPVPPAFVKPTSPWAPVAPIYTPPVGAPLSPSPMRPIVPGVPILSSLIAPSAIPKPIKPTAPVAPIYATPVRTPLSPSPIRPIAPSPGVPILSSLITPSAVPKPIKPTAPVVLKPEVVDIINEVIAAGSPEEKAYIKSWLSVTNVSLSPPPQATVVPEGYITPVSTGVPVPPAYISPMSPPIPIKYPAAPTPAVPPTQIVLEPEVVEAINEILTTGPPAAKAYLQSWLLATNVSIPPLPSTELVPEGLETAIPEAPETTVSVTASPTSESAIEWLKANLPAEILESVIPASTEGPVETELQELTPAQFSILLKKVLEQCNKTNVLVPRSSHSKNKHNKNKHNTNKEVNEYKENMKRALYPEPPLSATSPSTLKSKLDFVPQEFWDLVPTVAPNTTIVDPGYWAAKKSMFISKLFDALARVTLNYTNAATTTESPNQKLMKQIDTVLLSDAARSIKSDDDSEETSTDDEDLINDDDPSNLPKAPENPLHKLFKFGVQKTILSDLSTTVSPNFVPPQPQTIPTTPAPTTPSLDKQKLLLDKLKSAYKSSRNHHKKSKKAKSKRPRGSTTTAGPIDFEELAKALLVQPDK